MRIYVLLGDCAHLIYGKTTWQDKGGHRVKIAVPEPEWQVDERPELRIVTEELWQAAHTRLDNAHRVYLRRNAGQLNGKPESGLESKHLLSGFLRCKVCGGVMQINKRTSKRGRPQLVYVCATHRTRGDAACPEKSGLAAASIHEGVVFSLRKVLTRERLDAHLRTLVEDRPDHEAKRRPIQAELARVGAELKKLGDAVAEGASVQTLLDAIKGREAEKRELLAQLEHLDGLAKAAASYDSAAHLAAWKIILPDWSKALTAEGPAGRQRLRRLLRGPVYVFRGTDGVWRFEGHGTLGGVFKGWLGLQIMDEELDDMNAEADRLNAGSAFGPDDSLKNVPALEAEGAASTFGPQPMESAGLEPASAQVHYQWCPRHGT